MTKIYLKHKEENRIITCKSTEHAKSEYYKQERTEKGEIPWTIIFLDSNNEEIEINPKD